MRSERWTAAALVALLALQSFLIVAVLLRLRGVEERLYLLAESVNLARQQALATEGGGEMAAAPVEAGNGPARGRDEAPVTVVEFSDFTCPACRQLQPTLHRLVEERDDVRLVFRYFPLALEGRPFDLAQAAECARREDRFWEMHDLLFQRGADVAGREELIALGGEAGLNEGRLAACLESGDAAEAVLADASAGRSYGVSSTPTLFVNGRLLRGAVSATLLDRLVEDARQAVEASNHHAEEVREAAAGSGGTDPPDPPDPRKRG